ncbi:MAG: C25 family cysteine peptidase, partial [Thermoplasmatota archaeon]
LSLPGKISPAPQPVPLNGEPASYIVEEGPVYTSDQPYPREWVQWHTGAGIRDGQRVTLVTVHVYPARYLPDSNQLEYVDSAEVVVTYQPPEQPLLQADAYDLLIVTADAFRSDVEPLVEHKESYGMRTLLATTSEVYAASDGRDQAEKLKYYIRDAIEDYGIKYVLLVGGLTSLISGQEWHVPVRYVYNGEGSEPRYLSDLYFADIYNADGSFASWDTNDDGVYGGWAFGLGKDLIDGYPDVYVGRLACRNTKEVQAVVEKIMEYESGTDPSWFKRVTLVGGDTFNDISAHNYLEGEVATQKTAEYLEDFDPVKLWWSEGNLQLSKVMDALNQGSGFVHFSGHGSPGMWMGKDFTDDPHGEYILGMEVYHMSFLKNDGKYPVWVIGGCHNSMFNATFMDSTLGCVKSLTGTPTWYWMPIPECFGWWPVKVPHGGAIGTLGCTGLGYGTIGDSDGDGIPDCIQYLLGYMETRFFELYGQEDVDVLGDMWGTAISDYNDLFPPMEDKIDLKTVQEWVLLGDPSLKMGGYSS